MKIYLSMKSLTDFRKTVETGVDPRLTHYVKSYCSSTCTRKGEEGEGGRGTPYNGQYGEVLPERDTFFSLQVQEWARGFCLLNYMKR